MQEKSLFFAIFSSSVSHLSFFFLPLHPLFQKSTPCDGELTTNKSINLE